MLWNFISLLIGVLPIIYFYFIWKNPIFLYSLNQIKSFYILATCEMCSRQINWIVISNGRKLLKFYSCGKMVSFPMETNMGTLIINWISSFIRNIQFVSFRAPKRHLQGLWPCKKQTVEIHLGNKLVYSFTKTHDIVCLLEFKKMWESKKQFQTIVLTIIWHLYCNFYLEETFFHCDNQIINFWINSLKSSAPTQK